MTTSLTAFEANFDCLVGPTHHFGGLSLGNLASTGNKARMAKPKIAALQGLKKMKVLADRGFVQGVLPPHARPHMKSLRNLGFYGTDLEVIKRSALKLPQVFSSLCSSSFMWAANSATVSPKTDSFDQLTHITPANLVTMFHRSIEHEFTTKVFRAIFPRDSFLVHDALLSHDLLSDEGAANHNRLCPNHAMKGLQLFIYGKGSLLASQKSQVYPSRQSALANEALILRHKLYKDYFLNIEQNPLAIDAGAFHNDVVAVVNENVLLCHELAFSEQERVLNLIEERYQSLFNQKPVIIEIKNRDLSINDAVSSYLFNSQLLSQKDGSMLLFAPSECQKNRFANQAIEKICAGDNPIKEVEFFDVSESMANGGGPACLRLRVVLDQKELSSIKPSILLTDSLYQDLCGIIEKHYVEELKPEHFFDQGFLNECRYALEQIALALGLKDIYAEDL